MTELAGIECRCMPGESKPTNASWKYVLRFLAIDFGAWTLFALFMALQVRVNRGGEQDPSFGDLWYFLVRSWLYAVITPGVFWLASHLRFAPGKHLRSTCALVVGFLGWDLAYIALRLIFYPPIRTDTRVAMERSLDSALLLASSTFVDQFWMYITLAAIAFSLQYYRLVRERELREADLKTQMAEYELQILKLQLHPHFLFNTLNGISALMMRDVKTAREMIVRLSDLLRIALSHNSTKKITLRQELEFIDAYLRIEQMRFGSRLWVNVAVDPTTLDAAVPNMILQPLVENAIRHGIAPQRSGGGVEITTSRSNGHLRIVVANDGPELRGPVVTDSGIGLGLSNTRARLWQLYGDTYNLQMEPRSQGGVEVRLDIPFLEMKENAQHV